MNKSSLLLNNYPLQNHNRQASLFKSRTPPRHFAGTQEWLPLAGFEFTRLSRWINALAAASAVETRVTFPLALETDSETLGRAKA
jgi:hypothetical protein